MSKDNDNDDDDDESTPIRISKSQYDHNLQSLAVSVGFSCFVGWGVLCVQGCGGGGLNGTKKLLADLHFNIVPAMLVQPL